jgi:hypothetical protein
MFTKLQITPSVSCFKIFLNDCEKKANKQTNKQLYGETKARCKLKRFVEKIWVKQYFIRRASTGKS